MRTINTMNAKCTETMSIISAMSTANTMMSTITVMSATAH
jgi:hypothetical protein